MNNHFIDLARAGTMRPQVCSNGELRASKLAAAITENIGGLDETAVEGVKAFIDLARTNPNYAARLITEELPHPQGKPR